MFRINFLKVYGSIRFAYAKHSPRTSYYYPQSIIVALALCMNLVFLYYYNPSYHFTLTQLHGQVGYNLNVYGSVAINPALTKAMDAQRHEQGHLIDYDVIDPKQYSAPTQPFVVNDTIGYGLVLAALWNITQSFSFKDVQWLQIIIFSLLMLLLYRIAFILFNSPAIAFAACIIHLFFFPLIAMNVQPVRDIWAYYGAVIMLYGMLSFIFANTSWQHFMLCAVGLSICQYIRPSVFLLLLTLSGVFFVYGLFHRSYYKKICSMLCMALLANGVFFWGPFMAYNSIHYHRYFVGPVGLDLLEGLGEFPNPWGYKLDDVWASEYICTKYNVPPGTAAFDDKAREEFTNAFWQHPSIYFLNIFKRIPSLLLPALPWIFYTESPYQGVQSWYDKIGLILSQSHLLIDGIARHLYIRLYLLMGYLGIVILLVNRRYWIVLLLLAGVLLGGLGKLPSHIEYRYLVPYYWVFGLFATQALVFCKRAYR